MTYRLYTERFDNLATLTSEYFDAFTIVDATGYWRGNPEKSAIIEIATTEPHKIGELAERIRVINHQQAVLVTATDDVAWTIQQEE